MKETWRPIKDFTNYECSNLGRIRSKDRVIVRKDKRTDTRVGKILKPQPNKRSGYLQVNLYQKETKRYCKYVHVLVAETFLGDTTSLTVNHKDGDITNNKVNNLELVTQSSNLKHSYTNLNRPINRPIGKRKGVVLKITCTNAIHKFKNIAECGRFINLSPTQVRRLIIGECKNSKYEISYDMKGSETIENIS